MNTIEKINNLSEKQCIIDFLYDEVSHHKCRHCGKCTFGYEGISQLQWIIDDIRSKKAEHEDYYLLKDLTDMMAEQSLCEEGKEIAKAVSYALCAYKEDFEMHIDKVGCKAGVCNSFLTFHVLASKCNGCNECVDVCEDHAILGKSKYIHVIDLSECTNCGKCLTVCDRKAIINAGLTKPKGPKKPVPVK